MKVKFVGGAGRITGSCNWLVHEKTGLQLLVDCGLIQGGIWGADNQPPFPFVPSQIGAVILTHAHLDHCGRIPELFNKGFRGKILCTRPTAELTKGNLTDMMRQHGTLEEMQNAGFGPWLHQAFDCKDEHPSFKWANPTPIDDDVFVGFVRSSHLLGATGAAIAWLSRVEEGGAQVWKSACFSGDIGTVLDAGGESNDINPHPLLKRTQVPHEDTDYIVMESTYGTELRDKKYGNFDSRIDALREVISRPEFDTVVFPTFSIGRTQDILFDVLHLTSKVMSDSKFVIYMDSPSGIRATISCMSALWQYSYGYRYRNDEVARRFFMSAEEAAKSRQLKKAEKSADDDAHKQVNELLKRIQKDAVRAAFSKDKDKRSIIRLTMSEGNVQSDICKEIPENPADGEKQIIITSSGMFQGGPVMDHLGRLMKEDASAFVISGYQATPLGQYLRSVAHLGQAGEGEHNAGQVPHRFAAGITIKILKEKIVSDKGVKKRFAHRALVLHTNKIKGRIFDLGGYYSGHADRDGLLRYLFKSEKPSPQNLKVATLFLNHGTTARRYALRKFILDRTPEENDFRRVSKVEVPYMDSPFFNLDTGEWEDSPITEAAVK